MTNICKPKGPKKVKKCTICRDALKRDSAQKAMNHLKNITKEEGYVLFEKYTMPNSYGDIICDDCRREIRGVIDREKLFRAEKLIWLNKLEEMYKNEEDIDSNFSGALSTLFSSSIKTVTKEVSKEKRHYLNNLLEMYGCKYDFCVTQSYTHLTSQEKLSFLCRVRAIVKCILSIVAPNDVDKVFEDLCHEGQSKHNLVLDGNFIKVMRGVTSAYNNAED